MEELKGFVLLFYFGSLVDRFYKFDVSNLIKSTEDGLFKLFPGYNDNHVLKFDTWKIPSLTEFVYINLGFVLPGEDEAEIHFEMIRSFDLDRLSRTSTNNL
jgi:hypothetical protein